MSEKTEVAARPVLLVAEMVRHENLLLLYVRRPDGTVVANWEGSLDYLAGDWINFLDDLAQEGLLPEILVVDDSRIFRTQEIRLWLHNHGVKLQIRGCPMAPVGDPA